MNNELKYELNSTAEWRDQKAKDFPNDVRNSFAATLLRKLAEQEPSIHIAKSYNDAISSYESVFDGIDDIENIDTEEIQGLMAEPRVSEALRQIGFSWEPEHIDEVMAALISDYNNATSDITAAIDKAKLTAT